VCVCVCVCVCAFKQWGFKKVESKKFWSLYFWQFNLWKAVSGIKASISQSVCLFLFPCWPWTPREEFLPQIFKIQQHPNQFVFSSQKKKFLLTFYTLLFARQQMIFLTTSIPKSHAFTLQGRGLKLKSTQGPHEQERNQRMFRRPQIKVNRPC